MTLKTILKKHGIKIRGLESELQKWSYEDRKPTLHWYETSLRENLSQIEELGKLNAELHDRCKDYREQVQKLEDQVKAAEVKQRFTEEKLTKTEKESSKHWNQFDDEQEMVKHLTERIEELDRKIVYMKQYKS